MNPAPQSSIDLAIRFASNFTSQARTNGLSLAISGLLTLKEGSDRNVKARVAGDRPCEVEIRFVQDTVHATCTCTHFDEGNFCKHLYATLIVARHSDYLSGLRYASEVWVHPVTGFPIESDAPEERPDWKNAPLVGEGSWRDLLRHLKGPKDSKHAATGAHANKQLVYIMDRHRLPLSDEYLVHLGVRAKRKDGWGPILRSHINRKEIDQLPDTEDHRLLKLLFGALTDALTTAKPRYHTTQYFSLNDAQVETLLPELCRTGRFFLCEPAPKHTMEHVPYTWDDSGTWRAHLKLNDTQDPVIVNGWLERGNEYMDLEAPQLMMAPGILFAKGKASRFQFDGDFAWLALLRGSGPLKIPQRELKAFIAEMYALPGPTAVELPPSCQPEEVQADFRPRLRITSPKEMQGRGRYEHLYAGLSCQYQDLLIRARDPRERILSADASHVMKRDRQSETEAVQTLLEVGFKHVPAYRSFDGAEFEIRDYRLAPAVVDLVSRGWHVEAENAVYRAPGRFNFSVNSGIDWFDVKGGVQYGDQVVPFPRLLRALRAGKHYVKLDDGSMGILPEDWLRRQALFLGAGRAEGDALRYRPNQAMLLDALLAAEGNATFDEGYRRLRDKLSTFEKVKPQDEPKGFKGTLRPYQKLGLGWLKFLRSFALGGCLADDMGLGKTVQLLAYLELRKAAKSGPSLVVVPRSLVFNWMDEAARFTPRLRIKEHLGNQRAKTHEGFADTDVVLTTYGTLRQDAPFLKDVRFDCVILDEAQTIKNDKSATAKAARLLKGDQRIALSGTPIENHLGELWSLMEFLNPGLLGSSTLFKSAIRPGAELQKATCDVLARLLRPFILRRTKAQVAPELPERVEQTIMVDLEAPERKRYEELLVHYRNALLNPSPKDWPKLKFHVLEALLRLRQAACHPGLIDNALKNDQSAKLNVLIERLREITDEGHKVLVYSQCTTFLKIVRAVLDHERITYEYLDGKTRDRAERVRRFQTDPKCPAFLISLKAGGLGLNLTAADYVILLDPWWNPAVEAQAIDRTHRIGQHRTVFAYRLVARETVEEKVLQLQQTKRALADAIIGDDRSFLRDLTREDLALLLT